jgi:hypothetical protein
MRRASCLVVVLAAVLTGAQPASASHIRYVTFAARDCPTYAAINANEARNNIQESLKPLGADTPYGPNDAMDPVVEEKNQPLCKPLAGWRFTLGTGYQSRAVPGPWGNLSKVTGAYADAPPASPNPVTTLASTPLLNPSGLNTGATIAGAVTLQLTEDQVTQASKANNLWVMGGTPTDPVATPANYAFGALRCGVDNLNGDNVEWVTFPSNSYHVFCFAYYVTTPPAAGTIVVRKRIAVPPDAPNVPPQAFRFTGNVSFTPDPSSPNDPQKNFFDVSGAVADADVDAGQATFSRAAGSTWTFRETPPASSSATFSDVQCTSSNSTVTKSSTNPREVSVDLGAGDVVTCTYTNDVVFSAGLYLRKVTTGGLGTFDLTANPDTGTTATRTITTTKEGIPAAASAITAEAGDRYTITESPPKRDDGHWELASATCGGHTVGDRPVHTTIPASGVQFCTFTNRFVPTGSITLHKVTLGATATAAFLISPEFGTPATFAQSATTTKEGVAVPATGDDTTALPLGTYSVREMTPSPGPVPGSWRMSAVVCNGTPVAAAWGGASVTLTTERPKLDCTITNEFVPVPEPPPLPPPPSPPPIPTPTPLPTAPIDIANVVAAGTLSPLANLVVTKVATPRRVTVGSKVRYRVTVRNRGPATARAVTVVERQTYGNRMLALEASQGRCRGTPPRFCVIGVLAPGSSATVTVTVRTRRTGRFRNVVAANESTPDPALGANTASATITVVARPRPHFTG